MRVAARPVPRAGRASGCRTGLPRRREPSDRRLQRRSGAPLDAAARADGDAHRARAMAARAVARLGTRRCGPADADRQPRPSCLRWHRPGATGRRTHGARHGKPHADARRRRQLVCRGRAEPGLGDAGFGEPDEERLWEAVSIAMRLDEPDVVEAWREHRDRLQQRSAALERLDLDEVRYHGDATDLTVGIIPGARWVSGSLTTRRASSSCRTCRPRRSSPRRTGCAPTARSADPAAGACPARGCSSKTSWRLRGGPHHDVSAAPARTPCGPSSTPTRAHAASARSRWSTGSSRVRAAGVVFHDTLYDENAGCHVAWGQGFPFALADGLELSGEELFDARASTRPACTPTSSSADPASTSTAAPATAASCRSSPTTPGSSHRLTLRIAP